MFSTVGIRRSHGAQLVHPSKCTLPKLSARELFELNVGDRFIVYWAKDDRHRDDVRLDYETHTVEKKFSNSDEGFFSGEGGYAWYKSEWSDEDGAENTLDTSRGYAYFFKVE